ncbi:hypothetical protein D3C87_1303700 [compost metagenome]
MRADVWGRTTKPEVSHVHRKSQALGVCSKPTGQLSAGGLAGVGLRAGPVERGAGGQCAHDPQ